jgi:DNA primase
VLPAGEDPADLARRDPAELLNAVRAARPFLAFRLDRVIGRADLRTPEGRARAAAQAMVVIVEHPNELVRDQYLMQVADRCQIDPERLRGGAWRKLLPADGRRPEPPSSRQTPAVSGSGSPSRQPAGGPELEALRLAVHRPDAVADRLEDGLFADELYRAGFRALLSATTLHEAIAGADPEVADLLQRLAVEDADEDPDDVMIRLVERAGARVLVDLQREARASPAPEQFATSISWVKLAIEELRNPITREEAEARLVPWLMARLEEAHE